MQTPAAKISPEAPISTIGVDFVGYVTPFRERSPLPRRSRRFHQYFHADECNEVTQSLRRLSIPITTVSGDFFPPDVDPINALLREGLKFAFMAVRVCTDY